MTKEQEFEKWLKEAIEIMREVVAAIEKDEPAPLPPNFTPAEQAAVIGQFYTSNLRHNYAVAEHNLAHARKTIEEFVAKRYWPELPLYRADIEKLRELFSMIQYNLDINWNLAKWK